MANVIPAYVRRVGAKATAPLVAAVASYNIGADTDCMFILNGSGAPITATVASLGLPNSVVTIPAGQSDIILFAQGGGGPTESHIVTLSATASVTVGIFAANN